MKYAKIILGNHSLEIVTAIGKKRKFDFPAVTVSIQGKCIKAATQKGAAQKTENGGCKVCYSDNGIDFQVTVEPCGASLIRKSVVISTKKTLPTPDFVIVDSQKQIAPGLKMCGYMITDGRTVSSAAEEEGAGITPGCGYPLIGDDLFTGLEHPAAFNRIISGPGNKIAWELRHHPVWNGNTIKCVPAVIGISENPRQEFMEYLSGIRLPVLKNFLVSFCSFWSDPYLGNMEYKVDKNNYLSLVNAFSKMGLRPDVYTLDAGWQDRQSCFKAKKEFGGEKALKKIADEFRKHGSELSLWVSHNGPMGMAREFLEKKGLSVGSGQSSTYSGENYAVMMDHKLERLLTERFCELASEKYGAVHFKMDWENDSATNQDFSEKYPTCDHVREASIDVMSRISAAMRKTNPNVLTRNGWWPSPWWLTRSNHTFLTDSGDSEYACFPSITQRDAATTQRDAMYYAQHQRDKSAYPLDAYDNHEFAHALRNPFVETPSVWSNTCLWAFMRGASYIPLTIQPESLEKWQVEIFRDILNFARKNAKKILTGQSRMVGGSPSSGEVYGFIHPAKNGKILLALRNASPIPQRFTLPDDVPFWIQNYPHYQTFRAGETIWMTPHEVKVFDGLKNNPCLPYEKFMIKKSAAKQFSVVRPASKFPGVAEIYQIPVLEQILLKEYKEENSFGLDFGIRAPYKMRGFKLYFKLKGNNFDNVRSIRLFCSRNNGWRCYSCWQVPYQEHFFNFPGCGENKNPDLQPERTARYFSAEIPQGGQCFFNLIFSGTELSAENVELYASGFEAPAGNIENVSAIPDLTVIPQHPDGFPLTIQIL